MSAGEQSTNDSGGWTYFEAGDDSLSDVPNVQTLGQLQAEIETLKNESNEENKQAYAKCGQLVEAHRIHTIVQKKSSEENSHSSEPTTNSGGSTKNEAQIDLSRRKPAYIDRFRLIASLVFTLLAGVLAGETIANADVPEDVTVETYQLLVREVIFSLQFLQSGALFGLALLLYGAGITYIADNETFNIKK